MADRCPRCDREGTNCPTRMVLVRSTVPSSEARRIALAAMYDCRAHAVDWRTRCLAAEARAAEARTIATSALDLAETLYTEITTAEDIGCRQIINAGKASDEIERLRAALETK